MSIGFEFGYGFGFDMYVMVMYECLYICIGMNLYGFENYFVMELVLLLIIIKNNWMCRFNNVYI